MKATVRKKTYNLDEEMIDKVRRLFNVKTATETIQRVLQKPVEDREIEDAVGGCSEKAGSGPFTGEVPPRYQCLPCAFRSEHGKAQFRHTFFPLLRATFLSSVVAYELYVLGSDMNSILAEPSDAQVIGLCKKIAGPTRYLQREV